MNDWSKEEKRKKTLKGQKGGTVEKKPKGIRGRFYLITVVRSLLRTGDRKGL